MTTVLLWLVAGGSALIPAARRHRARLAEHTARARHHAGAAVRWRDHPVTRATSGAIAGMLAPARKARQDKAEETYRWNLFAASPAGRRALAGVKVRPGRDVAVLDGGHVRVVTPQRDGAR